MTAELDLEATIKTVRQAVKQRGVRWTAQREAIVKTFVEEDRHLTAEELLVLVREVDPSVSAATVYRTMNLLVESGLAAKRNFTGGSAAFEMILGKEHHHHLIDVETGGIIEFRDDEVEGILAEVAERLGYRISCHKIELFGVPLPGSAAAERQADSSS